MKKKREPAQKKERLPVHFTFKYHGGDQPYERHAGPSEGVKTLVTEQSKGRLPAPGNWKGGTQFERSQYDYVRSAWRKGIQVVAGEGASNEKERKTLSTLSNRGDAWRSIASRTPTTANLRKYFTARANWHRFRHKLIRRTVRDSAKRGGVQGQYGAMHSLLSAELRREGVPMSREFAPQVFPWNAEVVRRIVSGTPPKKISRIALKKAWVSEAYHGPFSAGFLANLPAGKTQAHARFLALLERTMLDRLSEKDLDEIIRTQDPALIASKNGFKLPFTDAYPGKKDLDDFLAKHSVWWKRKLSHQEMVRAAKKGQASSKK